MSAAAPPLPDLWALAQEYRPRDYRRLQPCRERYDADTLAYELWGEPAAAVLSMRAGQLTGDWRDAALYRQAARLRGTLPEESSPFYQYRQPNWWARAVPA